MRDDMNFEAKAEKVFEDAFSCAVLFIKSNGYFYSIYLVLTQLIILSPLKMLPIIR